VNQSAVYPSLASRAAFVSGGASGIGAAIVRTLAAQRMHVTFVDIDVTAGERIASETGAVFASCDVLDIDRLTALVGAVEDLRLLVNNAANDQREDTAALTPDRWRESMAVNLDHAFFASRAARPAMARAGGGSIINFGSLGWQTGAPRMVAYGTAKAAVQGLTKGLAREFGGDQIRVNSVLPGWVMTERQKTLWLDAAGERLMDERQCLPGRIQAEDVADMVVFLASDQARMCTGQSFIVDAGFW
jgi:D-xylose 1-dehydrogenase